MGGTYSGTATMPVQKGVAYAVAFEGVFIPAVLIPNDGSQSENDYRHKAEVRDIAGNVMNKTYAGPFSRARGTLKVPTAQASLVLGLKPLDTISMAKVASDGTLGAGANWMVEEDPTITFNREYVEIEVVAISEAGITPA